MSDNQLGMTLDQFIKLSRILSDAGFDAETAARAIARPDITKRWVVELRDRLNPNLILGRYISPEQQVANLLEWHRCGWVSWGYAADRITDERISSMLETIPEFNWDRPDVALTLCFTLNSVGETAKEHIALINYVFDWKVEVLNLVKSAGEKDSSTLDGCPAFIPNSLTWEVINFGEYKTREYSQIEPSKAAGLQVLSAVCHHPNALKKFRGSDEVKAWYTPGLQVSCRQMQDKYFLCIQDLGVGGILIGGSSPQYESKTAALPIIVK